MDWIYELLRGIAEEIVGDVVVPAFLALVILILALPVYFILKKASGSKTTVREDFWQAVTNIANPPQMRPASPIVAELDKMRSGIETVYLYLLYGVIALVTGFIIYFFATLRRDSNRDFLLFYFGAGYLVFMLFAVGQVFTLKSGRRRSRREIRRSASQVASGSNGERASGANASEFSFQFGSAPPGGGGLEFNMGFSSTPVVEKLDNDALNKAEQYLAIGENLDTVCRFVNPRFADWGRAMQQAYMECVRKALEDRRLAHGEAGSAENAAVEPDAGFPPPSVETAKPPSPLTILGLSPVHLVMVVMVFVSALMFFYVMMLKSRF